MRIPWVLGVPTFMTWEVTSVRSDQREQKRMRLHIGATNPFHVYLNWHIHADVMQQTGKCLKACAVSAQKAQAP
jgi:hypothetical protein